MTHLCAEKVPSNSIAGIIRNSMPGLSCGAIEKYFKMIIGVNAQNAVDKPEN
jgi:hypothetical protein